jgi:hypothetical protein
MGIMVEDIPGFLIPFILVFAFLSSLGIELVRPENYGELHF